jgi:hypothetical protein
LEIFITTDGDFIIISIDIIKNVFFGDLLEGGVDKINEILLGVGSFEDVDFLVMLDFDGHFFFFFI